LPAVRPSGPRPSRRAAPAGTRSPHLLSKTDITPHTSDVD
jgi:hypothetical protein